MSETCETVAVKADNDDGYMIINKSDVTKEHTVIGDNAPPPPAPPSKSKAELQAELDALEIGYNTSDTKADLQALLDAAATDPE